MKMTICTNHIRTGLKGAFRMIVSKLMQSNAMVSTATIIIMNSILLILLEKPRDPFFGNRTAYRMDAITRSVIGISIIFVVKISAFPHGAISLFNT